MTIFAISQAMENGEAFKEPVKHLSGFGKTHPLPVWLILNIGYIKYKDDLKHQGSYLLGNVLKMSLEG